MNNLNHKFQLFQESQPFTDGNTKSMDKMEIEESGNDLDFELNDENARNIMNEQQIFQVRQQIMAYKYLIRNVPIPQEIVKNITTISPQQWQVEQERIFNRASKFMKEKVEKHEDLKKIITDKITNNKQRLGNENMTEEQKKTAEELEQKEFKPLIDGSLFYIQQRKKEINNYLQCSLLTNDSRIRLQNEIKILEMRDFYIQMKDNILVGLKKNKTPYKLIEREFLDRNFFKRDKPQNKQEAKMIEKFEMQIRNEQETRKRTRHIEFMNALFQHQSEFLEFHRKKVKNARKKATHARNYIDYLEKRELDKKDKEEKERVKALKAQDFDAYMELVKKTKNTRILELLQATDNFLKQIGAKVLIQKGEAPDEQQDEVLGEMNQKDKSDQEIQYLKNSNKVYYNLTHTKKEEIKEQPSLLENGVLKSYQLVGLEWLVSLYNNKLNGILADEMGLGKTIQTIALFCYLMEHKKNFGPFLIVVPLTTLSNWTLEFEKWAPSIKVITYKGNPSVRKNLAIQLKTSKWNVCVTTYEYIIKDRLLLHKFDWKYIVVDEGHRMKNARSKFASTLGQQYNSEQRILLTGTPLQNNLAELWSLLNFLLPKVFSSCEDFEKWFSLPLSKVGGTQETESQLSEEEQLLIINRLHQVLRPFLLRRIKKEVETEIPNKLEFVIKIELSSWQKIVYNQIKDKGFLNQDSYGKYATKALLNIMMQLRKVCNHPYLFLNPEEYFPVNDEIFQVSGKFELMDRIIPKLLFAKHRLLIFSQMTRVMDILQIYFDYKGFKHLRLDGNTKSEERAERMAEFNKKDSQYDIFLLSTRAGGLGLNLQTADTVILFDSDWNPQMDLQAQDRAHRIGQKQEVRVYRLVTNTVIEEDIFNKAAYKMGLDQIIIQAGLFNQRSTDNERKDRIEELLKKNKMGEELDDEIPNDEQVNEMLARNEDELTLYDQMDRQRYEMEKKIYKNFQLPIRGSEEKFFNYRLTTPEQVPQWVYETTIMEEEKLEYGRGNRQRKQVNYYDDMTENQWLKNLEADADIQDQNFDQQDYNVDENGADNYVEQQKSQVDSLKRLKKNKSNNNNSQQEILTKRRQISDNQKSKKKTKIESDESESSLNEDLDPNEIYQESDN